MMPAERRRQRWIVDNAKPRAARKPRKQAADKQTPTTAPQTSDAD